MEISNETSDVKMTDVTEFRLSQVLSGHTAPVMFLLLERVFEKDINVRYDVVPQPLLMNLLLVEPKDSL